MYALLDDTDNLVGGKPIDIFRKARPFSYVDGGETYNVPKNWMTLWSLVEKNARHLFPLVAGNVVNKDVERSAGDPTYTFDGTNVIETIPVQDLTLAGYQSVKMREITSARDQEIVKTLFITLVSTEYAFEASEVQRDLMFGVMTALNSGMTFPTSFKWASIEVRDETDTITHAAVVATITENQAKTISQAMLTQYYGANKQFIELRELVDAATTRAEVDAIVWV